jgi:hypothetical protein
VFLAVLVGIILVHHYTSSTSAFSTSRSRFGFDISSFSSHRGSPYSPGALFPFFDRPATGTGTAQAQFPLEVWPSAFPERDTMHPEEWNERVLADLERCKRESNCGENQEKVALFASHQWVDGFVSAGVGANAEETTSAIWKWTGG